MALVGDGHRSRPENLQSPITPHQTRGFVDTEHVLVGAQGSNPSGYPGTSTRSTGSDGLVLSGKAWAETGVRLDLGDLESTIVRIKRA